MKKAFPMFWWIPILTGLFGLVFISRLGAEEEPGFTVENITEGEGEVVFHFDAGLAIGTNGVLVRYGEATLTADAVRVDLRTGDAWAEGQVHLQQDQHVWRGERLRYNFRTREMETEAFRTGMSPFFAGGEGLRGDFTGQVYTATNAIVTTDDVARPFYHARARQLKVIPGKVIEARHATLHLGAVPIMYFPYYRRNLDRESNHFRITPGYRSRFGPYLLGSYNWFYDERLSGSINLDYRQKRGPGAGPDFYYDLGTWGRGELSGYYIRDLEPGIGLDRKPIDRDRHRISFHHQANLRTNLTAKVVVREQSDAQVIRDFFEGDFRRNPQPRSFLEVNQLWPNYSLNFLAQPQLNDFFETVERLPDLKLTAARQQLGVSPLFYEGESSAGYFRFRPGWLGGEDYAAMRADTFHQLLLPRTFFGWLNVTPRVGGRFTHYGEAHGPGALTDEENRGVFNTGMETSFKASRVWGGVQSPFWDVNELRHIVVPSANYVFVPSPTVRPRELPLFDREFPSLRLLPIDFPDYQAIDSIDSQNVIRLGLRNRLQTKRKDGVENLVSWALFTDWRLNPRRDQGTFADLYSDLDARPRSWLHLGSEIRYDIDRGRLRLANHAATIQPGSIWHLTLGHRYFQPRGLFGDAPGLNQDNNIFYSRIYYRFNENWGARISHHFEARDGVLEEQYYTLYRDLRSVTAALTFRVREHRNSSDDYTVALTISLKALPRFGLGRDRDEPSFMVGG